MKSEEVMIGNTTNYNGAIYEIFCISPDEPFLNCVEFGAGEIGWRDLKPVSLKEEWLKETIKNINYPKWIKYLHELQNWYYWTHHKNKLRIKINNLTVLSKPNYKTEDGKIKECIKINGKYYAIGLNKII